MDLPLILSFVFAAIAALAVAWALWIRQTMAREAALVQLVRDRTDELEAANRRLEALSYQDALTGVANRRALDEALDIEWRRGIRSKRPISFLLLDIDHFKGFNDTYGHQAGDRTLAGVAAAIGSIVRRASDRVARYGGEEFAALLPDTDRSGAAAIAERMRRTVEALDIPNTATAAGRVTVSVGHATIVATDGGSFNELITAADGALYRAKHEGRNRVCEAGTSLVTPDLEAP
ncbi:hypothetical protein BH24ACI5_BH24ACI5_24280 [soil metagenome]